MTKEDMVGRVFGRWTVQDDFKYRCGQKQWLCTCECGTVRYVDEQNLLRGKSRSCGCISVERTRASAKDLTGQVFGHLTVVRRAENVNGRVCWECVCECGNTVIVSSHQLCSGKTRSCGCVSGTKTSRKGGIRDISGITVGFLQVLYPTEKRDKKGSVVWRCLCGKCGGEIDCTEDELMHGRVMSCGCYREELRSRIGESLHFVDNTCVEWLEKRKHRCDNTSGFRGVTRIKDDLYKASIGFRKQRYYLGYFKTYEQAVDARLNAEAALHDAFVREYREWQKKAEKNAGWAALNPFSFDDAESERYIKGMQSAI